MVNVRISYQICRAAEVEPVVRKPKNNSGPIVFLGSEWLGIPTLSGFFPGQLPLKHCHV